MTQTETHSARRAMIDSQLRTSGINDPAVLARMDAVAREDFVSPALAANAYVDRALPAGDAGSLAAPVFYGALLTEAKPAAGDRVLVVEGGSGYLAALVGPMVASVTTVSADTAAAKAPRGSFTLILVDGAVEGFPDTLAKALDDDGRVVTGLVERDVTRLASGRKVGGSVAFLTISEMGIPRLKAFDRPRTWSF